MRYKILKFNWDNIMKSQMTYTANYVPDKVLSNKDFEEFLDTNNEWIVSRTGIEERRIASDKENNFTLSMNAINNLKDKGADLSTVDAIVVTTTTKNHLFPSTASLIQNALGLIKCTAFDISAACSGYIFGVNTASSMVESGLYKHVLVVATEKMSIDVDWEDRGSAILFGDASSVVLIEANDKDDSGIIETDMGVDPRNDLLVIKSSGGAYPITEEIMDKKEHKIHMEGTEVFKLAVTMFKQSILCAMEKASLKLEDIKLMIPHQANMRIIKSLAKELGISLDKFHFIIQKYGNTSASSIGLALTEAIEEGRVKKGDYVLMTAFGAGLTWGTTIMKW